MGCASVRKYPSERVIEEGHGAVGALGEKLTSRERATTEPAAALHEAD